jgi:hypothetical protein
MLTAPAITTPPHIPPSLHTSLFHKHISTWCFLSFTVQALIKGLPHRRLIQCSPKKAEKKCQADLLEKAVSILWPCHLSCQLTVLVDTKLVTTPETEQCHLVNLHKYNHQNSPFYTNLLVVVGMDFTLGHCGLRVSCNKQVLNIHEKHRCKVLWHKLKSSWNHKNDSSIWTEWLW